MIGRAPGERAIVNTGGDRFHAPAVHDAVEPRHWLSRVKTPARFSKMKMPRKVREAPPALRSIR
jgi:hypothetical protein